jgi:hypothetical protein
MQNLTIHKAERKQSKLRIGVFGPSGSGKTYSSLLLAKGLVSDWNKIVIIDTENNSADLYSDLGDYNVMQLGEPYTPEKYVEAIKLCENSGMEAIIIDSISHEWEGKGGCLESNELLAQTKYKGNSWAAWSKTTPRHQSFIEAITTSTCHIISCGRSKTDTIQTEDKKIKKVGIKEITREGFEYEVTINFNLDREGHYATAGKDRTKLFIDQDPFVITEKTGQMIKQWSESGAQNIDSDKKEIAKHLKRLGYEPKAKEEFELLVMDLTKLELKEENYKQIIKQLAELQA